ncbi:energy transducer TonB, partial [bacterium]|nr:energy transducer TonB [bacterium]
MSDRVVKTAFIISFVGHCLFLGMPGFNLSLSQESKKPEEITVQIEIEKPPLLPKIDVMGEEKKLMEVVEEPEPPELEPEPEFQPEEVAMEPIVKELEPPEEFVEVINPAEEAILRYQDMVKRKIEEMRRYPSWAKERGIEGAVCLSFVVLANGQAQGIEITKSSGYKILDVAATTTVQRANPFPPLP